MRPRKLVLVWPVLAHAVAWAAFLWLALWPFAYRGTSVQAVPAGSDEVPIVTELSASFVEANGLWVLLLMLVPVVLTGLALLAVWYWSPGGWARGALLWFLAVLSIGFCVLGMLSFGLLFVPVALALVITAIVGMFQAPQRSGTDDQPPAPPPGFRPAPE